MDLNYLFYRQQVERSRAEAAQSEAVRSVHEQLAIGYEEKISSAAENGSRFQWAGERNSAARVAEPNPTMAVAITAREVAGAK
jgi:hypothetical protein